MEMKGK